MAKLRLLDADHYGGATLTPTNEVTALPAEASQNSDRRYAYRSTTGTIAIDIDIDLGSVKTVTAVAVANVTLFSGGALELYERGDSGSPGSATLVGTLSAEDADSQVAFLFPTSSSHRHYQLKFTNPSPVNNYCEAGYVFLGTYSEVGINVTAPFESSLQDLSLTRQSPSGGRSTSTQPIIRRMAWRIENAPEADRNLLDNVFRTFQTALPIFVVLDTTLAWTAMLVYFAAEMGFSFGSLAARYNIRIEIQEAPP